MGTPSNFAEKLDPGLGRGICGLLGATVPGMIPLSWLLVRMTDLSVFWWTGVVITFGLIPLLDRLVGSDSEDRPEEILERIEHDRFYRWATYCYLPNQYLALIFACWLWAGGGWLSMTVVDKFGLMVTVGIVGGIAINTAHELSHKRSRTERRLATLALVQTGYAHFIVEHQHGHHIHVATPEDTTTSRLGQSYYRFVPRSVFGGIRFAWTYERKRLARRHKSFYGAQNTILRGWLLCLATGAVLAAWFGPTVLPWLVGQAIVGVCVLESVNYVEHYGLRRRKLPDGRYERVTPSHSWNSNAIVTNVFLYHLQRHSDHHANPMRPLSNSAPPRTGAAAAVQLRHDDPARTDTARVAARDGPTCRRGEPVPPKSAEGRGVGTVEKVVRLRQESSVRLLG